MLTVALMGYASVLDPDDDSDPDRLEIVYGLALLIQTLAIVFLIIPIYLDAFILITGSIVRKCYSVRLGDWEFEACVCCLSVGVSMYLSVGL